jgi:dipeptidyl aminopeptidase/acylaminoacyl peptidase
MKRFLILLAILVTTLPVAAQPAFDFSSLMRVKRVGDPRVSPDGNTVLYTVTTVDMESNRTLTQIFSASISSGTPRQLTKGQRSSSSPRWSPDGTLVAFVTEGQIWTMKPDGSDVKRVTSLSTGASNPVWSPDGSMIAFVSEVYPECATDECNKREDERIARSGVQAKVTERLLYRHWQEWRDRKRTHLFTVDLKGGAVRQITKGDFDSPPFAAVSGVDFAFSPDSAEIAYLVNEDPVEATSTNSDVIVHRLSDGRKKNITSSNRGYDVEPVYTADGRYILYRSQATPGFEADRWRIMRHDRASGSTVELTRGFDLQADHITLSADGQTVYFTANSRGRSPVYSVSVNPDAADTKPVKTLRADGFHSNLNVTADGKGLVFLRSSLTSPAEVYYAPLSRDAAVNLSNANPPLKLSAAEEVEWSGALKTPNHGFIVKPADFRADRRYPLLVLIHGGPQGAWNDNWGYRWNPQIFANAGYVVFMPNPRGSTGYGQKFVDEISGDWGGKVHTDIMNGVAEVLKNPFVDRNRIAAAGGSYGGYMVNWILGRNNDPRFRFKALISHAGVYNLESMATVTEELWFVDWEFKGTPWDNPRMYEKWSPHRAVKNFDTPTLVIHGELDYRVPVDQGLQLYTALQRRKVPSKLLYFPDEGHWILKPRNSELWYSSFLDWLSRHVK